MDFDDEIFLGQGWSFPPTFKVRNRAIDIVSHKADIRQSLSILLSTRSREDIMRSIFGCCIHTKAFENITESKVTEIKDIIKRAILFYEPRIQLNFIDVDVEHQDEGRIDIFIDYTIPGINTRSNMAYSFYFSEGTNLTL